jgi:RING-box protein 1
MEPFIKIKNMNIISSWSYISDKNTDCTICRQSINNNSVYAVEKGLVSEVCNGKCGHIFHSECIKPWLQNSKRCPICSEQY